MPVLLPLWLFWQRELHGFREDVFKDHVGMVSVKSIIRTAKERRPGAMGYAEAMMLAYNNKNKYQLSLRTLYGGKKTGQESGKEESESTEAVAVNA